ncbi:hypothetical protein BP6252_11034 [Coleophoma cylindrospora]|uniref:Ubiquitin-like domain-containing protein n=1 Tax=Coleophoma cylindrospora TaxID=1849047 RepID=A0A3D8QNW7_9HELO|nr:hypothetical protein BP6252_11034 [Coleophoma cylindrospora]
MKVFVRDMTGRQIEIELDKNSCASDLKEIISKIWQLKSDSYRAVYSGKELTGGAILSHYGVRNGSTIHIIKETPLPAQLPPGPISVPVKLPDGSIITAVVGEKASVIELKGAIERTSGIDVSNQRLVIHGRSLPSQSTSNISWFGVRDSSVVELQFIDGQPYNIYVEQPDRNTSYTLLVLCSDSVERLKTLVEKRNGIPNSRLRLKLNEKILKDEDILADCFIDANCKLKLEILPPKIMDSVAMDREIGIVLDFSEGERDIISVQGSSTILKIKEKISEKKHYLPAQVEIRNRGRQLQDHETLHSYGLGHGKILTVHFDGVKQFELFFQLPDGTASAGLVVPANTTVTDVKSKILLNWADKLPTNKSEFNITLLGDILEDDSNLDSYDIKKWSTLVVEIKQPNPTDNMAMYDLTEEHDPLGARDESQHNEIQPETASVELEELATSSDISSSDDARLTATPEILPCNSDMNSEGMHLLVGQTTELSGDEWKLLRPQLPESFRWDIEYGQSCWTCTPSRKIPRDEIPLTIAGCPVVIPVAYRYPFSGAVSPPPDPLSQVIDPRAPIEIQTVAKIFKRFPEASGFYLLLNGLLQLLVPDNFNYDWAYSHRPNVFGGLKICYINQTLACTAGHDPRVQRPATPTATRTASSRNQAQSPPARRVPNARSRIELESIVEARPKNVKSQTQYNGRIGVKTIKDGKIYLTMSSHVITESLLAKNRGPLLRRLFRTSRSTLNENWHKEVDICIQGAKIGTVRKTFDTEAEEYPTGFSHDVSLVRPLDDRDTHCILSPIPGLGWLSRSSWDNLRRTPSNLHILIHNETSEAKTLPSFTHSECLIVGKGILLNRQKLSAYEDDAQLRRRVRDEDVKIWKSLVSQSILYRVYPDFPVPGGQSGLALYADGKRSDGTDGPGVVGFQSFVQRSGNVQTYEMEGRDLEARLKRGLVAFYGAFQIPKELEKDHVIL